MRMNGILKKVKNDVRVLMSGDNSGHGFDHVERVYRIAVKMAEEENADMEIVALAALLHDADDYKLFGEESAQNLTNAKKIMRQNNVGEETSSRVCEIIRTMGYSKALKGIRPQTLEGQIVSDADMLEAIGAMGLVRCLAYALDKCHSGTNQIFDEKIWPEVNLSAEEYKKPNRVSDNFVNHFFEKMLKLKTMMFTKSGRKEAEIRHRFMVDFLYEFFRENNAGEWIEYLKNFENERAA